jgi:hypothetical protein
MSRRTALLAGLAVLLTAVPATAESAPLPEGAVASVRGQVITKDDLRREVARRLGRTESGQRILERLIVSRSLETEAARRNVTVPASELDGYVADLERQAGGAEKLDAALAKERRTRADLRSIARLSLLGQKMAAEDLRIAGTPDQAQVKIWLDGLKRKLDVRTKDLPEGVVARVAGRDVTEEAHGEAIEQEVSPGVVLERVLEPSIAVLAILQVLEKHDVEVTDGEVDADIERRKREFAKNEQASRMGITFEQMVEARQGRTIAQLRQDREYRAVLGLRKWLASRLHESDLRAHFEKYADDFGERRQVQQIVVQAGKDRTFDSGGRTVEEARRLAAELKARLETGEAWEKVAERSDAKERAPFLMSRSYPAPVEVRQDRRSGAEPRRVPRAPGRRRPPAADLRGGPRGGARPGPEAAGARLLQGAPRGPRDRPRSRLPLTTGAGLHFLTSARGGARCGRRWRPRHVGSHE